MFQDLWASDRSGLEHDRERVVAEVVGARPGRDEQGQGGDGESAEHDRSSGCAEAGAASCQWSRSRAEEYYARRGEIGRQGRAGS